VKVAGRSVLLTGATGGIGHAIARGLAARAPGLGVDVVRDSGHDPTLEAPAALADLVRARDRTCRFPGCRQPARRCDLDHVVPWPEGSPDAANLAALCRHHHRLKHQTQWTVRAGPGADLEWIAPTGHRYVTSPAS
jgi:NAD(P)-dependent dehydrogenase (short-subunit alcohol dehydrogenase family)